MHNILYALDPWEDAIVTFLSHQIFLAPLVLLFIDEAGFPLPYADFAIAYLGYQVSLGHISFWLAFFLLLLIDLLGASLLYFISFRYGPHLIEKFGKYIHLDEEKLTMVEEKFRKYGPGFIIVGRHLPGFRIPITVFSGISKVPYRVFISSLCITTIPWILFYMSVGQHVGKRIIRMFHTHGLSIIFVLLPFIISISPFFFFRKTKKKGEKPNRI